MRQPESLPHFNWDEGPVMLLARHGETAANAARQRGLGGIDDFVQGVGLEVPLIENGKKQSRRLGYMLGKFVAWHNLTISSIHSSDARRAIETRDIATETGMLDAPEWYLDPRLREISRGDFEGRRRCDVYTEEEMRYRQYEDWHFRHGSEVSDGETAAMAGSRFKEWFLEVHQSASHIPQATVISFGHKLMTSYGIAQLLAGDELPDMRYSTNFQVGNGEALVVARRQGEWAITRLEAS